MGRIQVSSRNLASVGYEPASAVLEVEFNNGSVYRYSGVPEHVYQGLMDAASKGAFFDQYVKKAGYSFERIG